MDKKNKDYLVRTLGAQMLICVLMFGALFGLKQSNSELYQNIKDMFSNKLSEQINLGDVKSVFKTFSNEKMQKSEKGSTETTDNETVSETEYIPFEEPSLSAEVTAKGGADVSVSSEDEIPDNVSLDGYKLSKKMILPLKGTISSEFGIRTHPISGDLRFHAGTDIAAKSGSPIYAAFDGKVSEASYDQWNGNYVKIIHDNDIMTVYCHCSKLNVKKGQVIRAGEIIAFVGSTGSSTGPHLHFEIRINNISYNPNTALKDAINVV